MLTSIGFLLLGCIVAIVVLGVTADFIIGWASGSANGLSKTVTKAGVTITIGDPVAAPGATTTWNEGFLLAELQGFMLTTSGNLKMRANDPVIAVGEFNLTADIPFQWVKGSGIPCPFTVDVTKLCFVNDGALPATVSVRILEGIPPVALAALGIPTVNQPNPFPQGPAPGTAPPQVQKGSSVGKPFLGAAPKAPSL